MASLPVCNRRQLEQRKLSCFRVVTEVVAERTFSPSPACRHPSFQHEFGVCRDVQSDRPAPHGGCTAAADDARKGELVDPFGQRHHGRQHQRRVPTQGYGHFKRLVPGFGPVMVKPAPLLDLHVHAGGDRIVDVHSVDAHIRRGCVGIAANDEREGDEAASVSRPALQHG